MKFGTRALGRTFLIYVIVLIGFTLAFCTTQVWAGCGEICREWPRADFSQVNPHCCCEDFREVQCPVCPEGCRPLGFGECACPCVEPSPTPAPTPESHVKNECCKEARAISQDCILNAYERYLGAKAVCKAQRKANMTECREDYAQ